MIRGGDMVLHKPSGETWIVCGVSRDGKFLVPCGYPFPSFAKVDDCFLIVRGDGQKNEFIKALEDRCLYNYIEGGTNDEKH